MRPRHRPLRTFIWGVPLLLLLVSAAVFAGAESVLAGPVAARAATGPALAAIDSPSPRFSYVVSQSATAVEQAGLVCIRHFTGRPGDQSRAVLIQVAPNAAPALLNQGDVLAPGAC